MLSRLFLGEKAFLAGRIEKEFRNEIKVEAGWRAAAGSSATIIWLCAGVTWTPGASVDVNTVPAQSPCWHRSPHYAWLVGAKLPISAQHLASLAPRSLVTKLALAVNSQKKMGKIQLLYNVVRLLSRRTKLKIWSFYVFREEFWVLPELSNPDLLQ